MPKPPMPAMPELRMHHPSVSWMLWASPPPSLGFLGLEPVGLLLPSLPCPAQCEVRRPDLGKDDIM